VKRIITPPALAEPGKARSPGCCRAILDALFAARTAASSAPLTFRFSGLRITVQDSPRGSLRLLSKLRCTPMDAGVRGCMRLEMGLPRSARPLVVTPGRTVRFTAPDLLPGTAPW
jgi:hypothetical protein